MFSILLILKVLGIIISGASVIGSQRLKTVENRLRVLLKWQNINKSFNKIKTSLSQTLSRRLRELILPVAENNEYLAENYYERIRGFYGNNKKPSQPQNKIVDSLRNILSLVAGLLLLPVILVGVPAFFIVLFVIFAIGFLIELLFIFLPLLLIALLVVGLIELLKISTWLVSRPYAWLDFEIKKREIESTIVVIGIIIAVTAEIISNYVK